MIDKACFFFFFLLIFFLSLYNKPCTACLGSLCLKWLCRLLKFEAKVGLYVCLVSLPCMSLSSLIGTLPPQVLAMSSRSWLSYSYQSRFHLTPLSYETLEFASGFASEQCPEGIVAISTNTLRILALEKLGAVFNQVAFPLQYTPRKFVIHPESNNLIIIETDHNAYTEATKAQRKQQMAEVITLTSRGAISKRLPVKLFRKV